ncbi:RusA family crossover junction endodeoxyribonuclease [Thermocrinis albus]|uniref:RusA family crossover junction endodeoxyribonuclease n=1 Tax=Thermocrinis albus TaxID=136094 RepID=UPI0011D142C5|nr:RusA family crossover junction endodeoxyribonuclease [Thermocrinis albus]
MARYIGERESSHSGDNPPHGGDNTQKVVELYISTLPVPKSNRYIRRRGGKVFKPPRIKNWEVRALWEIKQQYSGSTLLGPLRMEVELTLPNRRKRDIDNMLKSLWDILEKAKVIGNDDQIQELYVIKRYSKGQQGTKIRIIEGISDTQ